MTKQTWKHDVFVSHNQHAKPWVRRFVQTLRSQGLNVFFDEDSINPGSRVVAALDQALVSSRFVVLIVTPAALQSDWVTMEAAITIHRDPSAKHRTLIPVMLEKVVNEKIPASIRSLNYVPLFDPSTRTKQLDRLLISLGVAKEASAKIVEAEFDWRDVPEAPAIDGALPPNSIYVQKRTRDLVLANFPGDICDLDNYWTTPELSFSALVKRAKIFLPNKMHVRFRDALTSARSAAYDDKYAKMTEAADERSLDLNAWESELYQILRGLGMENSKRLSVLNVGIGNGREWTEFYSSAKKIVGVDVSSAALESAATRHKELRTINADAADLSSVSSEGFDIYLSLRTYQSTLFDIDQSVFEAARVLRPGGIFVASLSDAHRVGNSVVRGILLSGSNQVDRNQPYALAEKVRRSLTSLGFNSIGLRTGHFEVYVYGRRAQ
jgi:SAM-dependent methyltransferase